MLHLMKLKSRMNHRNWVITMYNKQIIHQDCRLYWAAFYIRKLVFCDGTHGT